MSTYRLHKSGPIITNGWQVSAEIKSEALAEIPQTLNVQGGANKIATSIPTPFARMYMFETAFEYVTEKGIEGNTLYHLLVSDCLDLLDLIYAGAPDEISFNLWRASSEIEKLRTTGLKTLADGLETEIKSNKLFRLADDSFDGFSFIYWNNILVGGTSPRTLAFTSPNWREELKSSGRPLPKGSHTTSLFSDEARSLASEKRSNEFRDYIWALVNSKRNTFFASLKPFLNYVDKVLGTTHAAEKKTPEALGLSRAQAGANTPLGTGVAEQQVFYYTQNRASVEDKVQHESMFKVISLSPKNVEKKPLLDKYFGGRTPLALMDGMSIPGVYVTGQWDQKTRVPNVANLPFTERKLPDTSIQYPWIGIDDLLEDTLLVLDYELNTEFFHADKGASGVLYPVKPLFIELFGSANLLQNFSIRKSGNEYTVSLGIETEAAPISFVRSYSDKGPFKAVVLADFVMGIFPFIKIKYNTDLNHNFVMSVSRKLDAGKISLSFYDEAMQLLNVPPGIRETENAFADKPEYAFYEILGSVTEFISVNVGNGSSGRSGIIMPKYAFRNRELNVPGTKQYVAAIDFGTSNTHVEWGENGGNRALPLDLPDARQQMVMLNAPNRAGKEVNYFYAFRENTLRYFTPPGNSTASDQKSYFPLPTAFAERPDFESASEFPLFTTGNAGFFYSSDQPALRGENYKTGLKWALDTKKADAVHRARVSLFFRHLLLMVKAKCLLEDGNLQKLTVAYTLTSGMKSDLRRIYVKLWEEAFAFCFPDPGNSKLVGLSESEAPFHIVKQLANIAASQYLVNVDIGGGTADFAYYDQRNNRLFQSGVRLAGNDLWGQGDRDGATPNGFSIAIRNSAKLPLKKLVERIQNSSMKSDDFFNLIYSLATKTETDHIEESILGNNRKVIFLLHYAALLFYASKWAAANKLEPAHHFSFTGKGSKYLDFVFETESQKKFTRLFLNGIEALKGAALPDAPDYSKRPEKIIRPEESKEITARGAALMAGVAEKNVELSANASTLWLGFGLQMRSETDSYIITDTDLLCSEGMKTFNEFISVFFDNTAFRRFLRDDYDLEPDSIIVEEETLRNFLLIKAKENIEHHSVGLQPGRELEECLFIWAIRNSLFELTNLVD
ncbi:MAG: hypothetical protein V4543_15635 [Bacteroidota bacterium]